MNKEEKIYLDKKGYDEYLQEIKDLKEKLRRNGKLKTGACDNVGDRGGSNFDFEDAKREEIKIFGALREKIDNLSRIVIIDSVEESELVDINNYVLIRFDDEEEMIFKLVGSSNPDLDKDIMEISINSPLGKSVYQKCVGSKVSYNVDEDTFNYFIVSKSKQIDDLLISNDARCLK